MKLIIAEKPSVARDLAAALPGTYDKIEDSYYEGPDYLISWAVGHLLELAAPEHYNASLSGWSLADLPVIPDNFVRKPREGATKQLRLLKKLALRDDVKALINACAAAREGELIFREIEAYIGEKKPSERLWLQSMTKDGGTKRFHLINFFYELNEYIKTNITNDTSSIIHSLDNADCTKCIDF